MTLYERYLAKEFLKNTFLFLLSLLSLFVLIDYASHSNKFFEEGRFSYTLFLFYTAAECLRRLPSLTPFALMLSTIKTITQSSQNLELLGHMVSGRALRQTLQPLLLIAFLFTLLIYTDLEWGIPKAFIYQDRLKPNAKEMQMVTLNDGTPLFFQTFLREEKTFVNAFWVQNIDHIIFMKRLITGAPSVGEGVRLFDRNEESQIELTASFDEKEFEIPFKKNLTETLIPPEELPLSVLVKRGLNQPLEKQGAIIASYYHKLSFPWLSFLAVLAPLPFSVLFKRDASVFPLYALGLFGLTALLTLFEAGFTLSKREMVDPFFVTLLPLFFLGSFFTVKFLRCDGSF